MSLLCRSFGKIQLSDALRCLTAIQKRQGHWYPYFKPGPYPKTEEERKEAAKKYNLLPEEYQPYPETYHRIPGDYPMLPFESVDSKDPWHPWDDEELRRGFNEPVHADQIILLPEMLSTNKTFKDNLKGLKTFLSFILGFGSLFYFLSLFNLVRPAMEKQMPAPGVTHYTFEFDYDELQRRKKKKIVCKEEDDY